MGAVSNWPVFTGRWNRLAAVKAGAVLQDIDGQLDTEWRMEVVDEGGRSVLSLGFSAIKHIRIKGEGRDGKHYRCSGLVDDPGPG